MANDFEVNAVIRSDAGKGASRRLRHAGQVPAIIYGGEDAPQMLSMKNNEVKKNLESEAFYSSILSVTVDGKSQSAVLRDVQWHPARGDAMHLDFLRVSATESIRMHVPLHFLNEDTCVGVATGGGLLIRSMTDVEVQCLPGDLPEAIEYNVAELDMGESVHLSDLTAPEGVEFPILAQDGDHNLLVVSVQHKAVESDEDGAVEAGEADAADDAAE